jgi:two-component system sensor histidine kinase UhpB
MNRIDSRELRRWHISQSRIPAGSEVSFRIAKHAHAKMGCVAIAHRNDQAVMRISDNGLGFATHGPTGQQGIGLLSMRERVRMLGGSFEVKSAPNTGTIATVTIPTGVKP